MKTIRTIIISAIFLFGTIALAQSPPHPNGGNAPAGGNTPVGGGASLGGGLIILLSLGLGYGTKKIYQFRKRIVE